MIAGNATPIDARMMWKPSVNAIWLRAGSSCDAARVSMDGELSGPHAGGDARPQGVLGPADPGRLGAVEDLRAAVAGERLRGPLDERVDARVRPRHERGV